MTQRHSPSSPFLRLLLGLLLSQGLASPVLAQTDSQSGTDDNVTFDEIVEEEKQQNARQQDAPGDTMDQPATYTSREMKAMRLLAATVPDDQVVWLKSTDEEFLALYHPENTGAPEGALLLLHAEGQSANWPMTIQNLRTLLPDYGWSTLSLSLPLTDPSPVPPRTMMQTEKPSAPAETPADGAAATETAQEAPANQDQAQETPAPQEEQPAEASDTPPGDGKAGAPMKPMRPSEPRMRKAELRVKDRLTAAINYLHQQGQFNIIVIGDGIGAVRSLVYLSELPPANREKRELDTVQGAILVNSRNQMTSSEADLPKLLMNPRMKILDIFYIQTPEMEQDARRRKIAAQRMRFRQYEQLKIAPMTNRHQEENRLTKRVRGWLNRNARGTQKKAVVKDS